MFRLCFRLGVSKSKQHVPARLPAVEDCWTDLDGLRFHAVRVGAGAPVVLVHGYGVSGRYMLPLARALAPTCSVFVPDLPGHGRSQSAIVPPGIDSHAGALARWLVEMGLERPAIVANSMGCQVVTKLAEQFPDRVGPMVLIGPTVDPERRRARHQVFDALRDSPREPRRLFARATVDCAGQGLSSLLAAARSVLADRIEDRLPFIEQTTIVIVGDEDGFVSKHWAEQVAGLLPRGRLVVVPGEPHAVHYTRPGVVGTIVTDLIAEEAEDAACQLGRRLPHRHMPALKPDESRIRQEPPPLLRHAGGYEPVAHTPHE
jgi:pimeloyl-ACP methyl ester carboxylesterase